MEKEKIRQVVIDTYIRNMKDIDETMEVLSTLQEPLNQLTKKQVQGILVFAKVWESKPKPKRETKGRVTKKDILPELEKFGVNTTGLTDATVAGLQNLLNFLQQNLKKEE
jgi:hypothetical protein